MIGRRELLQRMAALTTAGVTLPLLGSGRLLAADAAPATTLPVTGLSGRVVIVGGGMAGATLAKFLRLWGGAGIQVTLVEQEARYTSNILSNLVLTDTVAMGSLLFDYTRLRQRYGVTLLTGTAVGADPVNRRLSVDTTSGRQTLAYDRLVLAPGIDFEYPAGLETAAAREAIPHAWKAGPQTTLLRAQIRAIPAGGTFVMTIPAAPYRCPPGPYERACVVADWLKRNRPRSKVIVLDANPQIMAERATFERAFGVTHAGVVQYVPNAAITAVDAGTRTVQTTQGSFRGQALNVIPTNVGPALLRTVGVGNAARGFAGVNVLDYQSTAAAGIHVIGDACATTQPKAGHIGNQEAKVCADAILRSFGGQAADPSPVTNSACYSPITLKTASWLTAVYAYDPQTMTMKPVGGATGEAERDTQEHFKDMYTWIRTLMADSYG